MLAFDFPLLDVFYSLAVFAGVLVEVLVVAFVLWAIVFRRPDLRGWRKAFWVVLISLLPVVGVVGYFVISERKLPPGQAAAPV
jgi:cytochrome bd-type quinol oxidase subunit 2